ncbi:MAG: hypothetical protein Q8Q59_06315 [Luteolibacter sp.]|nr:hypothetical protein [Luteolibacter sp.]
MIESLHQIDFITGSGTLRLLDIGAIVDDEPAVSVKQSEKRHTAIGAQWSENQALGGAETSVAWTAVRNHASQADLRGFCMRHAASLPSGQSGTLRVTISGGEVWDIEDCVISSSAPQPLASSAAFETVTAYQAAGGRMVPGAAITLYAGIPWVWILQDWDDLSGDWDDL